MPSRITEDTDNYFTVDDGFGSEHKVAKTPGYDAPGGIYDQIKKQSVVQPDIMPLELAPRATAVAPMQAPQVAPTAPQPMVTPRPQLSTPTAVPSMMELGSSTTQTQQSTFDPQAMSKLESSIAREKDALAKEAEASSKIQLERAEGLGKKAQTQAEIAQMRQTAADDQQKRFTDYQNNFDKLYKEYSESELKPRSMFDGNVGQDILTGIGVMLGSIGGAMQGSNRNVAIEMIDKAIERDLDVQKQNIEKKREGLNVLGVRYQAARAAGMDDLEARLQAKADAYESAAAYIEQKVAPLQNEVIKAKGLQQAAILDQKAAETRLQASKGSTTTTKTTETKPVDVSKLGPQMEIPSDRQKEIVGLSNMNKSAQQLRDIIAIQKMGGPVEGRLLAAKEKLGITDANEANYIAKVNALAEKTLHQLSGTAASEAQTERIKSFTADLKSNPEAALAKLDSLIESSNAELDAWREAYRIGPDGAAKNFSFPDTRGAQQKKSQYGFSK